MVHIAHKTLNSGFSLPVLGIGTWMMGGGLKADPRNNDEADISAIRNAVSLGITHIDTAEKYAEGKTEEIVGKAIAPYDRKELILTTKVAEWNHSESGVQRAVESSLKRLNTDYIDLLLLHAPNPAIPIRETMRGMNHVVDRKLVRNIGVSNFSIRQLQNAQKYSNAQIVANQLHYNLLVREVEHKNTLSYCQENDILLIAWRPLEKGLVCAPPPLILDTIARKINKPPTQIALNWLIAQKNVVSIFMSRNIKHMGDNMKAVGWSLESDTIEQLRSDFPNQKTQSPTVPTKNWTWD